MKFCFKTGGKKHIMRVAFIGDVGLFGRNSLSNSDWQRDIEPVKGVLASCDYVVANLETPLTTQKRPIGGKSAYLKGRPEDVELLKALNITHVTLANNHAYDYGKQGLLDTISVLEENGVEWYGVNDKTGSISDSDNSLALMGYCCYSTNGMGLDEKPPYINELDPKRVEKDISEALFKEMFPVVSFHWGQEHVHYPNYDHVELSRRLCENKAILIHGHHPHVIQGIEEYGASLVAYSLGNFCFDDVYTKKSRFPLIKLSQANQESFVLIANFKNNKVESYGIVPFSFYEGQYKIDDSIAEELREYSDFLETPEDEYIRKRSSDLQKYLNDRKQMRDLSWYLKRLNFESFRIISNSRRNSKMYNKLVKEFVSSER